MKIVDVGSGPALVLVPGVQGRWEWMKPGVDALSRGCRVITFSLADEPGWGRFDSERGLDSYVEQIHSAMDLAGVRTAVVGGVSFAGPIAALFAARHPDRVNGLLLVSAIAPDWTPDRRVRFYIRAPRLLFPLFCLSSLRLYPEIAAAHDGIASGLGAALRQAVTALTHMLSPTRVARRVRLLEQVDVRGEVAAVRPPVLVLTGDDDLERVVPVRSTRRYLDLWPHARWVTLHGTGHLGLVTKPAEFAQIVVPFVESCAGTADIESRRRIG